MGYTKICKSFLNHPCTIVAYSNYLNNKSYRLLMANHISSSPRERSCASFMLGLRKSRQAPRGFQLWASKAFSSADVLAFLEPRKLVEGCDLRPDDVAYAPWLERWRLAWDVNTCRAFIRFDKQPDLGICCLIGGRGRGKQQVGHDAAILSLSVSTAASDQALSYWSAARTRRRSRPL